MAGILLVLVSTLAMFSLTGFQATSETAGSRLLGRLGSTMVELDLWLPVHQEELALLARDRPEGLVQIRDLPFSVAVPADQLATENPEALRGLLVAAFGNSLYEQGTGAFRGASGEGANLVVTEPIRWVVSILSSDAHGFWQAALALTLLLALALAALVLTGDGLPLWHISLGAGIAAAFSLGAWLLIEAIASSAGSLLDRETFLVLRDGAWIGVRNGFVVALAAAALALIIKRFGGSQEVELAGLRDADIFDEPSA